MLKKLPIIFATIFCALPSFADDPYDPSSAQTSSNTETIAKYIKNLGTYLGFDLTTPAANTSSSASQLLNAPATQLIQNYLFNTVLGATPISTISASVAAFVPNSFPVYGQINAFANYTFNNPAYNTQASSQQGTVSVSSLIDQQSYQQDPVSQAVYNILTTPNYTYCMSYDQSTWNSDCSLLYDNLVTTNVLGNIPNTQQYFSGQYNAPILSQLNSNSLLAPLLYSQNNTSASPTSSSQPTTVGLSAQSQAQQAANFIRYVTAAVSPMSLPKLKDYDALYSQATNASKDVSVANQKQAQATLANYLANVRIYAAQSSVGFSNLYAMLAKRIPQSQGTANANPTSQALSEFTMATRRLYNPDESINKQWINQINQASDATLKKEMLTLLAEINYQLYLNRVQDERLLLTNTILLLQNARASQPSIESSAPDDNSNNTQ